MWKDKKSNMTLSNQETTSKAPVDNLQEDASFLGYVCNTLNSVTENVCGLLTDISTLPSTFSLSTDLDNLQKETYLLKDNIESMVGSIYSQQQAMGEAQTEVDEMRVKYQSLQQEWEDQQEHMGKMLSEVFRLRNQLQNQSEFCASLGAVMGNLVWKSSRNPDVINLLLAGNKIGDFLCITHGTLTSFLETYRNEMPNPVADESQFILAMCGIVANLAALPSGRQFIVTNMNGVDLMNQFISTLPKIPTPSGNCLKRLILMALYNVGINDSGLKFLQRSRDLLKEIAQSLKNDTTKDVKLMSLRLLQSITYELDNPELLKNIDELIPIDIIMEMSQSIETDIKIVAKEVLENVQRAERVAEMTKNCGTPCDLNVPFEECYFTQSEQQQNILN